MITLLLIIIEIKLKCTKNARKENKRGKKKLFSKTFLKFIV